jgi:hypothetical protein
MLGQRPESVSVHPVQSTWHKRGQPINVIRLSNPDSVWYGADDCWGHRLTLCIDDPGCMIHAKYHGGIRDEIFGSGDPSVPSPEWRPPA